MGRSLSLVSLITLFAAVFPFMLLPILTRYMSIENYGKLVIVESFLAIMTTLLHFLISGIIVEYYKLSNIEFKRYLGNSLMLLFPAFILAELIIYILTGFLSAEFNVDSNWLKLLPIIVLCSAFFQAATTIAQCNKNYYAYAFFIIFPNVFVFILTIYFLIFLGMDWESKLFAITITYGMLSIISIYYLKKKKQVLFEFDKKMIKDNINFTLPLLPHSIAASLYFMADRLLISYYLGYTAVAVYAAGMQLALIMSVIQNALSKAWSPYVLEKLQITTEERLNREKAYKSLFKHMLNACFVMIAISAVVIISVYIMVDFLLPESYVESKYLGAMLVGGFCLLGFYKIYSPILWFYKKTNLLSLVTVIVFCINIFLNIILIPNYGVNGACYATVISIFFQLVFTLILVYTVHNRHGSVKVND